MTHHTLRSFWRHYDGLPAAVRRQADKQFDLLKSNPQHPSLEFKPVAAFHSARVDLRHRVLGRLRADDMYWFWIGPHGEYDRLIRLAK